MADDEKEIKTLMENMKSSLIKMELHEVLDLWYDLREALRKKDLM